MLVLNNLTRLQQQQMQQQQQSASKQQQQQHRSLSSSGGSNRELLLHPSNVMQGLFFFISIQCFFSLHFLQGKDSCCLFPDFLNL